MRPSATVIPFPSYKRFATVMYRSVSARPMIHGLFEVDVTAARSAIRDHQTRTGEKLSFTAFLAGCLARAVDEHKEVQAFRRGAHLVLFDDVDVNVRVEREVPQGRIVVAHVLRAANRRTMRELHDEIRAVQAADALDVANRFRLVPGVFYGLIVATFNWLARRFPRMWKQSVGTVGITSVGMFGEDSGWGIPSPQPTALMLTVGGIGVREVLREGRPAVREMLCLTVSVDHDLVDGAPAARFTRRLKELIESAHGLEDHEGSSAPGVTVEARSAARTSAAPRP